MTALLADEQHLVVCFEEKQRAADVGLPALEARCQEPVMLRGGFCICHDGSLSSRDEPEATVRVSRLQRRDEALRIPIPAVFQRKLPA